MGRRGKGGHSARGSGAGCGSIAAVSTLNPDEEELGGLHRSAQGDFATPPGMALGAIPPPTPHLPPPVVAGEVAPGGAQVPKGHFLFVVLAQVLILVVQTGEEE